jgi:hypothetical protein
MARVVLAHDLKHHWRKFAQLWRDGDPALQVLVQDAQAAIRRLEAR